MNDIRTKFQKMIRRVLKEEVQKRDSISERLPVMTGNGIDRVKKENKVFASSENPRDAKTKPKLLEELTKIVNGISSDYSVVWDDHDDIMIDASDLMSMRITPDWEDHYEIETMIRNEDRIWVTGLSWEQVTEFVKKNLSGIEKRPTGVDKAYDKSYRNRNSEDQGASSKGRIKSNPVKEKKVGNTSNKDKDFNEKQNKEEDNPDKPMKEVGEVKKQSDFKVKDPVKLRKKVPDKKLIVKK